jgi:DNA-binding transcriptional MerR regulator
MLKIGDFSKLSRVSIKTLRYYDEMGLFKPSMIDRFTGYRYYTLDQLSQLNRILALKDLGLSLEQIRHLLDENVPSEQIRGMLRLKQAELQQVLDEEQARLERVAARLRLIEEEGKMPDHDIVLKQVESIHVASIADVIPSFDEAEPFFERVIAELCSFVSTHKLIPVGAPLSIYHSPEELLSDIPVEFAVPVQGTAPDNARVKVQNLPALETAACAVHQGTFDQIGKAYESAVRWIESNGYRMSGPSREIYLQFDRNHLETCVTEIQFPVARE